MPRVPRYLAPVLALVLLLVPSQGAEAQKKRASKKVTVKKAAPKKAAAPARPTATGTTLEQRVQSLFDSSIARSSESSLLVTEVESGRVVAAHNADMPVAPASNMKLFTTGAAMRLLGPDFQFRTTVAIRGNVDPIGTLHGDVLITGRGDPTIGSRFHDGDSTAVFREWARDLNKAGVKTVGGNLIFNHGYFDDQWVHPTWPADQLVNWYEAPVSALAIQEGCVMVRILPGKSGGRGIVQLEPPNTILTLENTIMTGGGRGPFVTRRNGTNTIIVKGNVRPKDGPTEIFVTVLYPVNYFANAAHLALEREGIKVQGQVLLTRGDMGGEWRTVSEMTTPLSLVNDVINKKSQNFYAEQLIKTIGAERKGLGSWENGSKAITEWLVAEVGVDANEFQQIDGSGMSRFNRASSDAFVKLLRYMWKAPGRGEFVASMPYSGEDDSRLRRRLNKPPYARSVYAKTGYISGVIGLSGYVHGRSGKVYAFSFLFNKYRTGVWGVYSLQDEILKEIIDKG
ncbi:MAG TPA: D-alanyl-D-alanine carboxypeptidase/D-alanyl-D-alanine-endopeptidase [Thermoanaerobaculia bacterium]|nr:D-alanyl-D-alanine carboxypeptidase/D-alanyl-D-alanine-endopeptidase [Thermoanaerobaculia bacterium]